MVLFTELMAAIEPHLGGQRDKAAFMRDMLERLSAVPESQWFNTRATAPGGDHADSSLRKFYSRGISKKLAKRMLDNPTRDNFVDSLNYVNDIETESANEVKAALAEAVQPFTDIELNEDNVGNVLFDLFQQSFNFIVNPALENDRTIAEATKVSELAKGKHGTRLLEECKHTCSNNGCGCHLATTSGQGVSAPLYGVVRIAGPSRDYENLIALCPSCFQSYVLGHKKADETALKANKQAQVRAANARDVLSSVDIERGITKVIERLGAAKSKDFEPLNFDPVAVKNKIDEDTEFFLYSEVLNHVRLYFRFIERQMQEAARQQLFDDTLLRAQIKALSKKLVAKDYGKTHVHAHLAERLSNITKQDPRYCAYVVSYFVQSCEVFDAAA